MTGAGGFIGLRLAPRLQARGHEVVRIGRGPQNDLVLDLLDEEALSRVTLGGDALVHLAWHPPTSASSPENDRWVQPSRALVKRFVQSGGAAVIVAGSCFEYAAATAPLRESDALEPTTPYGQAKARLFQLLAHDEDIIDRLRLAWARIFFAYGPGEPPKKLIPWICGEVAEGRTPALREPDRLVDYIYIDDVAEGLARMLERGVTGAVNLGSGNGVYVRSIARSIAERLRPELVETIDALDYSPGLSPIVADTRQMNALLGMWSPVQLETGLTTMIAQSAASA